MNDNEDINMILADDFVPMNDLEAMINLREWMQKILEQAGCEISDGGMGSGKADIGFRHQGGQYGMSIWPRLK